jgi:hypothetical protein
MFAIMPRSVRRGFVGLSRPKGYGSSSALTGASSIRPYTMLALNLLTQLICVAGVNQLSSVCTFFFWILTPPLPPTITAQACFNYSFTHPPHFPIRHIGVFTYFNLN